MNSALIEVLRAAGKESLPLTLANGSEVLVLPYGGRVLGLFAPGDARNFLWTNPALASVETARDFYASGEWANSGGDRTWLAPEIDFFLPNYPQVDVYHQPRSLDPGSYVAETSATGIRWAMDFQVTSHRAGKPVSLRLSKSLAPAPDPLKARGVQYAGYELRTVLEALETLSTRIGIWNLLQMPFGGEMIISTYGACEPVVVFGKPPEGDLNVGDHHLRYRMSAEGDHKISLLAKFSTGRVGYFYENDGNAQLIVRNFFVNPSGDYVDAAWADPSDNGYGVQACNVNGKYGTFSELEYHVPAMSPAQPRSEDRSQVWAYRGSPEQIREIANQLLGVVL